MARHPLAVFPAGCVDGRTISIPQASLPIPPR